MNILEAEDMVKGLPDQVLFQYAQNPPPQIPQFLAISEVQRRQDMRQRFQMQQGGNEPTVKDQILQGGIASAGGPPAPMGAAPPGAPMQQPMTGAPMGMAQGGLTPGGIVRMQTGRTVPGNPDLVDPAFQQRLTALNALERMGPGLPVNMDLISFVRTKTPNFDQLSPREKQMVLQAFEPQYNQSRRVSLLKEQVSANPAAAAQLISSASVAQPPAPVPAPAPAAPPMVNVPPPAANVPPGGIADAGAALGATPPGTTPRPSGMSFQSLLSGALGRERSPEVQQYIDMQRQMSEQGLPPPVDLSQFVKSAQQRQQEARDEARRMAIAGTLMNLGAGVMSGDPAAGLRQATQTAMGTLAEGRREAAAEGRTAEQLQLQAAQQERQTAIDAMRLRSETLGGIANIVSGEEKANRSDQLAAAQLMATYETALAREVRENQRQGRTDANSMRAARTSALQQASQYLRAYLERTGEEISDADFAQRVREMAKTFDPESFASSEVFWDNLGGGR